MSKKKGTNNKSNKKNAKTQEKVQNIEQNEVLENEATTSEKESTKVSKETKINIGLIHLWINKYNDNGLNGLENKKKPGNPLCKYSNKKKLTKEEQLEYENMKLRIENEMLKKGYLVKGDGTIVKFMK